eukprot:m.50396 g.50396  ORF g.50396 m.50396 type:complete len:443 (-) comp6541_c0_seq2:86-1414(-)
MAQEAEPEAPARTGRMAFFLLWISQFVSLLGTDVAKFAVRVWIYEQHKSVTSFALLTFFAEVPALLLAPLAGSIIDRCHRKTVLVAADATAALATASLYFLHTTGDLAPWHIYAANALNAAMNAIQWPAFTATVSMLVPQEDLVRYGGLKQMAPALSMLLSPAIAGILVEHLGLHGAFVCELATCAAAVVIMVFSVLPARSASMEGALTPARVVSDAREAWTFVRTDAGLVSLLALLFAGHFGMGIIQMLTTPLILNYASPSVLGSVLTLSGLGALLGAGCLSMYKRPIERKAVVVLVAFGLQGVFLALCGLIPRPSVILAVAFLYMAMIPTVRTCREAIWQIRTPQQLQGRVFALQHGLSQTALPLAALLCGPLVDSYLEPSLVEPNGLLAQTFLGSVFGSASGAGSAMLFALTGSVNVLIAIAGLRFPPLANLGYERKDR